MPRVASATFRFDLKVEGPAHLAALNRLADVYPHLAHLRGAAIGDEVTGEFLYEVTLPDLLPADSEAIIGALGELGAQAQPDAGRFAYDARDAVATGTAFVQRLMDALRT